MICSKNLKKIIKLQIALRAYLFELWTSQKTFNDSINKTCINKTRKFALQTRKSSWTRRQNILHAHAEVRAQKNFDHRIFHEILHLPDTLNAFISLKVILVEVFKLHFLSWNETVFQKICKFSNLERILG